MNLDVDSVEVRALAGERTDQGKQRLVIGETAKEQQGDHQRPISANVTVRLLEVMWRHPYLMSAIVVLAMSLAVITTAVPWVATETIRVFESPELWNSERPIAFAAIIGGVGIALLACLYYVVMGVRMYAVNALAERVVFDLRHAVFEHLQSLDISFYDRHKLGRILSRGTSDIDAVRNAVAQIIPRVIIHGMEIVLSLVLMVALDWVLALIILGLGPILFVLNNVFRKRMGHAYRRVRESYSRVTANVAETVSGIRVTQAFSREDTNAKMFHSLLEQHKEHNMHAARQHGMYIPLFDLASQATAVIVIVAGAWRVQSGAADVVDLVGFFLYSGVFFISVIVIAELYNTILQAMAGGERIFALLDTPPTIVDAENASTLARTDSGAAIRFEDASFEYVAGKPVLEGVSFSAAPGETIALVGHTGAGKTTIVSLIARFYAHTGGRIWVDDEPIESIELSSLRAQLGMVPQDNFLFAGTVRDNIRFGNPGASDEEVVQSARDLDCLDLLESLPNGFDTEVGERGSSLSLGQRQLVCFCRAMIANPRMVMLDEATSAVDTFTEHRVQLALERLMAGRTCIVVAHRLSTIRDADHILVLDHGKLVEQGTHDELLNSSGLYRELHDEFVRLSSGSE